MNTHAADIALAGTVRPRAIHSYLAANGWKRLGPHRGDTGDVYCLRDDQREFVLVPSSKEFADYTTRLLQLSETLGRVENRHLSMVLADLSQAEADRVRVRLTEAQNGTSIPLSTGVCLLEESRKLLLAAACSVSRSQHMFRDGQDQQATAFIDSVRLDQTERDGFVVNLLVPVSPPLNKPEATRLPIEPLERKATRMLVSGLRAAQEVTRQANRGESIRSFHDRIHKGVSANLCQALANLVNTGSGLEVSVSWSLSRPAPGCRSNERAVVAFSQSDAPVLQEVARVLGHRQVHHDERIEGFVSALERDHSDPNGRATIKAVIDDAMVSVKVDFDQGDYDQITKPHNERLGVSLEGDLRREGQRWHLANPRDLMVIEEDD